MPTKTESAKRSCVPETTLLRGRVTRASTIVKQCKVPTLSSTPRVDLGLEFLCTAPLRPQQTPIPHPVLAYTLEQMKQNAGSELVKWLKSTNDLAAARGAESDSVSEILWLAFTGRLIAHEAEILLVKSQALIAFGWNEMPAKYGPVDVPQAVRSFSRFSIWDFKADIPAKGWSNGQMIDFSPIGKSEREGFYYDIWANIHLGYVGRAAGFTKSELLSGADTANFLTRWQRDDCSDKTAIQIGIGLYNEGGQLTITRLLRKIYEGKKRLNKWSAETGYQAGSCQ